MLLFHRALSVYFGYVVTAGAVTVDPMRLQGVLESAYPTNPSEVRGFLGALVPYRRFAPKIAELTLPLNHLTEPRKFVWGV